MAIQGPALPNKKHLPYGGARAINNHVIEEFINYTLGNDFLAKVREKHVTEHFLDNYYNWLQQSTINNFHGLDEFKHKCFSNGTTETFDKWFIRNQGKRLRVFSGEYMYHYAVYRNLELDFKFLEYAPLDANDCVVISMPFADSGNMHHETLSVLDTAAVLGVPVLIDAAYVGLTKGISFDFGHPAIDTVTFSLSKTFPVSHARIGMRLCREDLDDGLDIYRKTDYDNKFGAALGNSLITNYGIDYNVQCYEHWQRIKCQEMKVEQSKTVLFGLGGPEWKQYNRGGLHNRLFLGGFYEQAV